MLCVDLSVLCGALILCFPWLGRQWRVRRDRTMVGPSSCFQNVVQSLGKPRPTKSDDFFTFPNRGWPPELSGILSCESTASWALRRQKQLGCNDLTSHIICGKKNVQSMFERDISNLHLKVFSCNTGHSRITMLWWRHPTTTTYSLASSSSSTGPCE